MKECPPSLRSPSEPTVPRGGLSQRPHMAIQDTSQTADTRTLRSWQEIPREVTQEQDPVKVRKLSAELNQAMLDEERREVRLRLQSRTLTLGLYPAACITRPPLACHHPSLRIRYDHERLLLPDAAHRRRATSSRLNPHRRLHGGQCFAKELYEPTPSLP